MSPTERAILLIGSGRVTSAQVRGISHTGVMAADGSAAVIRYGDGAALVEGSQVIKTWDCTFAVSIALDRRLRADRGEVVKNYAGEGWKA